MIAFVSISLNEDVDVSPTLPTLMLPSLQKSQSSSNLVGILFKLTVWGIIFNILSIFGLAILNLIFWALKFSSVS